MGEGYLSKSNETLVCNQTVDLVSDLAVEECVRIFDREKKRKDTLEAKASTLLNTVTLVITILISVIGVILSTSIIKNPLFFGFDIFGIISLTICMILLIWVLRTKGYIDPFETDNIDQLRPNFEGKGSELKKQVIKEYTKCFVADFTYNNRKVKFLKYADVSLIIGISLVITSILVLMGFKIMY
jgi:predicted nucleic acid-binding Zn ribbon protein